MSSSCVPVLRTIDLSKQYGALGAVSSVSLAVEQGEFVSLLGPSGCGKTTLLRMIAGLEIPTSGRIEIEGRDYTNAPANRRPTNMVFQSYALFPHLTVEQNVGYGLLGKPKAAIAAEVAAMLDFVRLGGLNRRFPHQLSGGQRQRVGLARAIICKPRALLLDEPLSALDKNLREAMQAELRAIQRRVGISFVLVTHDQEEAFSLSDRVMVMSQGSALQYADPVTLYRAPASLEVAKFVGDINLFDGRVALTSEDGVLVETQGLGSVTAAHHAGLSAGDKVTVAIRPESFQLSRKTNADQDNLATALFTDVAFKGNRFAVNLRTDNGEAVHVQISNQEFPELAFESQSRTSLSWSKSSTMLFRQ